MQEEEMTKIVKRVLMIVKDNLPTDCEELLNKMEKKFLRDIRDLGTEKAFEKWYKDFNDEEDVEIISS
ncbi:hypothetical protein [Sulfolobus acidocaldarius]|uniref:Uncharacterized protein n=3 Tax=Sulfolobus acidocaldarius TaxID=2285 RepID=A0A0U2N8L9_9CREN|nr:hypothetical protein [Sulfolobus acidocaldarius]AGE71194.1 hypothetical protein SacN8_06145 [Sulfolobus acidocaldarius N8]AGE73464.1 hypothetical protein SacRon12I_06140 [Sulfolobus acidocaldarius Ron12/I]ALU28541.1 hypothetical protein ATY89_00205 [Sulfolobus acidocaldarius]ALU31252.1 hypothetical protein ATZ20_03250 [Sulfolobus acidocaldarius]WCM35126.1 hypothetical protein GO597_07160 [Sulfolobus acidocaldarius DSM 639]